MSPISPADDKADTYYFPETPDRAGDTGYGKIGAYIGVSVAIVSIAFLVFFGVVLVRRRRRIAREEATRMNDGIGYLVPWLDKEGPSQFASSVSLVSCHEQNSASNPVGIVETATCSQIPANGNLASSPGVSNSRSTPMDGLDGRQERGGVGQDSPPPYSAEANVIFHLLLVLPPAMPSSCVMAQDNEIVLVTSDDPPVRFPVSRARLCTFSPVFSDLLSLTTSVNDAEGGEIVMTETASELKLFMAILQGQEIDSAPYVRHPVLSDEEVHRIREEWRSLAEMAHKYECAYAAMSLTANALYPTDAFVLAVALRDDKLIGATCAIAFSKRELLDSSYMPIGLKEKLLPKHVSRLSKDTAQSLAKDIGDLFGGWVDQKFPSSALDLIEPPRLF
ncbi:uncharacterized protein JCM15063_006376 [Sporobolomyces koalae]|uniref:uncharacterized protein n=1 Tax=Sporobolomyces koalae TaxID=500713 RepID=UPI0031744249